MQMVSLRNHQRQRNPSLLDQQQQIDHFHCHVWVLVQHHAEHPLLHTHTHTHIQLYGTTNTDMHNHACRQAGTIHTQTHKPTD